MEDCLDNRVIRTISRGPVLVSVLLAWALTYVGGIFFWVGQFVFELPFGPSSGALPEIVKYDLLTRLFVGSLVAPIAETFLFQWLPIRSECLVSHWCFNSCVQCNARLQHLVRGSRFMGRADFRNGLRAA